MGIKRFIAGIAVALSVGCYACGGLIAVEMAQERDIAACEKIFIDAFSKAYEAFTPEQLGVVDKVQFLKDAFDSLLHPEQHVVVAKNGGRVVGFAGFTRTEQTHQIYISQLAVDPGYWHQGVGRHLVFSALDLFTDANSLVVIPRRINGMACQFYEHLGFVRSSYMHPGYTSQRYIGYEWRDGDSR